MRSSAKQAIVVGMTADPEPHEAIGGFDGEGSVADASLEVQRGMSGVLLQVGVRLIGLLAYVGGQGPIERPEVVDA